MDSMFLRPALEANNLGDSIDTFFHSIPNVAGFNNQYLSTPKMTASNHEDQAHIDVAYLKEEVLLFDLLRLLELNPVEVGEDFPSPLLNVHDSKDVMGCFNFGDDNDVIIFNVDTPTKKGKNTWLLQEFYANFITKGRVGSLETGGQKGIWLSRMLADLGRIELPKIALKPLSVEHIARRDYLKAVYDGFILAMRCHLHYAENNDRTTFSADFAAAWCNITVAKAKGCIRFLRKNNYIYDTGEVHEGAVGKAKFYKLCA